MHRNLLNIGIKKSHRGWFLSWVNKMTVSTSKHNKEQKNTNNGVGNTRRGADLWWWE